MIFSWKSWFKMKHPGKFWPKRFFAVGFFHSLDSGSQAWNGLTKNPSTIPPQIFLRDIWLEQHIFNHFHESHKVLLYVYETIGHDSGHNVDVTYFVSGWLSIQTEERISGTFESKR